MPASNNTVWKSETGPNPEIISVKKKWLSSICHVYCENVSSRRLDQHEYGPTAHRTASISHQFHPLLDLQLNSYQCGRQIR
ncbi:hypothetical protein Agabi119p4_5623 [Agaricus bisporus var. burnettii]|uniref:Uncharacterized protein n=1 Tax=Agaricus bisporus var. burnettii TaxID=192524 RepID=A0A8H7KGP3_AGABI|nr:hypothetical protein Agabi119p4_5623 [Agaricus bisporus var. burnettii]